MTQKKIPIKEAIDLLDNLVISHGNNLDRLALKSIENALKRVTPLKGECDWCGEGNAPLVYYHKKCVEEMIQFVDC